MRKLNAALVAAEPALLGGRIFDAERARPERVIQFGAGNFLRGFVEPLFDVMNAQGLFNGRVVIVSSIDRSVPDVINEQDGLYTLVLRGISGGSVVNERSVIASVSRAIDPYRDFRAFLALAWDPALRFIVSNTTEAGIAFRPEDRFEDAPPASFPGKLTRLLFERYQRFGGDPYLGFILLPCELIDRNGESLKRTVLRTAEHWNLPHSFAEWVERANVFTNTLVDRIVTGCPRDEATQIGAELGYEDRLLDIGEPFYFWAIEAPEGISRELPFAQAPGFDVQWTADLQPWRDRKVRILNGAHTSMSLAAYLSGKRTVGECMADPEIRRFLERTIAEEIIPGLTLERAQLQQFAAAVLERFSNPFLKHELLSIALNSVSKYRARILPSVKRFIEMNGHPPERLSFALAALIAFYDGRQPVRDDESVLDGFAEIWSRHACDPAAVTTAALARADWWGQDLRALPAFGDAVARHLAAMLSGGVRWF